MRPAMLEKYFGVLESLLFPEKKSCMSCGGITDEGQRSRRPFVKQLLLCSRCEINIHIIEGNICLHCGRQMTEQLNYCTDCQREIDRKLKGNRSAFQYGGQIVDLLTLYKFRGKESLAHPFAAVLHEVIKAHYKDLIFKGILYVPLHPTRQYERGFNQSELMARELSALLDVPLVHGLERIAPTVKQSKLGRRERLTTLLGSIESPAIWKVERKGYDYEVDSNDYRQTKLLLIDDVYTTGSTSEACVRAIHHLNCDVHMVTLTR